MQFAVSYSFGKDSAMALLNMIQKGHTPVCLITTVNKSENRSWFHGINDELMDAVSKSLAIPLIKCICDGSDYNRAFEASLKQAARLGAKACVFGDIDIESHLRWNQARCHRAKIACIAPLWQMNRAKAVSDFLDSGFKALIKCVQSDILSQSYLGKTLDDKVIRTIKATGADVCGENGEYHTFVYDGPLFHSALDIELGRKLDFGKFSVIDMNLNH